jgi:hypothetical protein
MRNTNYGFKGLNTKLNPQLSGDKNSNNNNPKAARVISIVLDSTHPRFNDLGGWTALGAIEFDYVVSPQYGSESTYGVAYPLNCGIKHYPLVNEIVHIESSFSNALDSYTNNIDIKTGAKKKYYTRPISVWNHPHHNAYSFTINDSDPAQNKTYEQTIAGSTSINSTTPVSINLGSTFKERDVNPLLPFEGDIIYEGRFGNSIRFGSTVMVSASYSSNDWSTEGVGQNGDPILIIKNGQNQNYNSSAEPILEDININNSSIYLTSTQRIFLNASSTKGGQFGSNVSDYPSYDPSKKPDTPNKFSGAQILLSSGRLVFNSSNDHILLTSAKSINLNSLTSVNIDSPELSIQSNKIYLGKYQANEPLMLGTQTVNLLKDLVQCLTSFMNLAKDATTNVIETSDGSIRPVTLPIINLAAQNTLDVLNKISNNLGNDPNLNDCILTSKRNYTV